MLSFPTWMSFISCPMKFGTCPHSAAKEVSYFEGTSGAIGFMACLSPRQNLRALKLRVGEMPSISICDTPCPSTVQGRTRRPSWLQITILIEVGQGDQAPGSPATPHLRQSLHSRVGAGQKGAPISGPYSSETWSQQQAAGDRMINAEVLPFPGRKLSSWEQVREGVLCCRL